MSEQNQQFYCFKLNLIHVKSSILQEYATACVSVSTFLSSWHILFSGLFIEQWTLESDIYNPDFPRLFLCSPLTSFHFDHCHTRLLTPLSCSQCSMFLVYLFQPQEPSFGCWTPMFRHNLMYLSNVQTHNQQNLLSRKLTFQFRTCLKIFCLRRRFGFYQLDPFSP